MRVFEPLLGFSFKSARRTHRRRRRGLCEEPLKLGDAVVQDLDCGIDVFALCFERDDALLVLLQRRLRLGALIDFVEIEDFLDLYQREATRLPRRISCSLARSRCE